MFNVLFFQSLLGGNIDKRLPYGVVDERLLRESVDEGKHVGYEHHLSHFESGDGRNGDS
jgi:hypothetical protein